uniref:Uncharacterized protein n=1 Tax=Nelumbo nucifera TaxID=4432 RepID=A0A822ZBH6_NELNU|nr:TPA_asm: hypothetical protein HUJ06_013220 [Nelumbo nucifera]
MQECLANRGWIFHRISDYTIATVGNNGMKRRLVRRNNGGRIEMTKAQLKRRTSEGLDYIYGIRNSEIGQERGRILAF